MKTMSIRNILIVGQALLLLSSCTALKTAPYDQYSFQKAVEIKVEASNLMKKATNPFSSYEEEVEELQLELEKMVVYEANKPNNGISYEMWKLLADQDKNLLAGLLKRWEEQEKLGQVFLNEAQSQVTEAIDMIIRYEGKKDKESESGIMQFILDNR
ncbi:hypothetical protein [Flagellimonas aurea]|uniref:hypothetical protein n=1 Tax=Flagellimonas aurea TaxID=2915619 RepID=UPI0035D0629C